MTPKRAWTLLTCLILDGALASLPLAGVLAADRGEFTVDEHTLFLAHFNDSVRRADYATGIQRLAGSGATLVDGYYGKAADLTFPQYNPEFLTESDDYTPEFKSFGFYERGNIDNRQGTLEFWLQVTPPEKRPTPSFAGTLVGYFGRNTIMPGDTWYGNAVFNILPARIDYVLPFLNMRYERG